MLHRVLSYLIKPEYFLPLVEERGARRPVSQQVYMQVNTSSKLDIFKRYVQVLCRPGEGDIYKYEEAFDGRRISWSPDKRHQRKMEGYVTLYAKEVTVMLCKDIDCREKDDKKIHPDRKSTKNCFRKNDYESNLTIPGRSVKQVMGLHDRGDFWGSKYGSTQSVVTSFRYFLSQQRRCSGVRR